MILECPACDAKFKVPDGSLGEEGRRVRCGKCSNMWIARPPQATKPVPMEEAVKEETSTAPDIDAVLAGKPKAKSKKSGGKVDLETIGDYKPPARPASKVFRYALFGSYAVLAALIACMWAIMEKPEWWGVEPTSGFAFEQIEVSRMNKIGGDRFSTHPQYVISGVVRNVSDQPKMLPIVRVSLKDTQQETIYKKNYILHDQSIPPGDSISFLLENLEQASPNHSQFIIEMGNRLELALRSVEVSDEY